MIGEIISIQKIECKDEFVYNLEVESDQELNKNYFADGILVSNCHRMSAESVDSLLKLIEEPPARVMFILCTTDIQKMRPAIVSRCQKHTFKPIYWTLISEQLERISKLEKIEVDKTALNLCAKLANGSMRLALQNLEKLIDFAGEKTITSEHAENLFGQVSETLYYNLLDQIFGTESNNKADASQGYRIINSMLQTGTEFSTIYENISEHLRNIMIGLTSSSAKEFMTFSEEGKKRLSAQLQRCKEHQKLHAIVEMLRCLSDARKSVDLNISAEIALQQWFIESVFAFRK